MSQDPNREFDKTCLKVIEYDGIHRDYAAHFFRWGFISTRLVKQQETRVLDIGCGSEYPLAKILRSRMPYVPKSYLGIDLNNFKPKMKSPWLSFKPGFNFAKNWKHIADRGPFDLITCLEVAEHMTMPNLRKTLVGARELLADGGRFVLSTPVFNGRAAKNHVNEMTVETLSAELARAGWKIEKRFGTFMNVNEIKKCAGPAEHAVMAKLREYYSDEVISCFLAPLHPDHARNNIWICKKDDDGVRDLI